MKEAYARYLLNKTQSDYNKIADQFAKTRKEVWFGLDFLFQDLKKGERILDLGCGNGRLYQIFKKKEVVYQGVDFSE
ncbi:MAG: methyltransferase domain-containing protein, partial [Candidatus Paceibacterota bacterium]